MSRNGARWLVWIVSSKPSTVVPRLARSAAGVVGQHVDRGVRRRSSSASVAHVVERGEVGTVRLRRGAARRRVPVAAAAARRAGSRPTRATCQPRRASSTAAARPMPGAGPGDHRRVARSEIFHRSVLLGHGARLPWRHIDRHRVVPEGAIDGRCRSSRRSCLAVPGSSVKMLGKAQGLPADQVFLDLEDAVAPLAKPDARKNIVAALNEGDWAGKTRVVRVNDLTTPWTYRDVIEVVEGAGANLDCIMLPKVQSAAHVAVARPDADPDREDARPAGRPDRHRGADRERAPAWSTWTPSRPPRPAWRRSSSARPTSWPRST